MRTTAYDERDYTFGQTMLRLRTEIGLTQAGLANMLGVSRRAVAEWEAGSSYPKTQHLKALVALGVKSQAFRAGHEAEEIRALWKVACQKVLLDEHWLSTLLEPSHSLRLHVVSNAVEESMTVGICWSCGQGRGDGQGQAAVPTALPAVQSPQPSCACPPIEPLPVPRPRVDWGDALAVPIFYGREEELALLSQWIVQERCRVVSVLGMGGIGKSALSGGLMYQLAGGTGQAVGTVPCACPFEVVIFRSLRDAPPCEVLLDDCLQVLSSQLHSGQLAGQAQGAVPMEQRISLLLSYLRKMRVLVVLDNLESLLEAGDPRGHLRPGFEGYGLLLRRVAETSHQSCWLVTSREKLADLRHLESKHSPVRSLRLTGLDDVACKQLFVEKEVVGTEAERERLIEIYGGNPLALKIVAETIFDLFGGEIGLFLAEETLIFGGIADLLSEQFVRLSALEKTVLCWLAIAREPMTLDELLELLVSPLPRIQVLEAVDGLRRRSLIERGKRAGSFTLQAVVLEYVTSVLIAEGSREIQEQQLDRLIEHGLCLSLTREYERQTQERLLLSPLLASLQNAYLGRADGARWAQGTVPVEMQLLSLLSQLRGLTDSAQGYGPANLIALLRVLRGDLSGLDLSYLSIRGAYLQNVEMHDTSLAGALMRDSVWTSAVSAIWAVAISFDGEWWAAGSLQGQVHVWEGGRSQTLRLSLLAHTDMVEALAFSPDGRTLASGSTDGTVKLWDLSRQGAGPRGALLWAGGQYHPLSLAFSPDGHLLASGGMEATVRLWDPQSGRSLQTLAHPSPVHAVAFSPDGSLLASGGVDGQIRLWERQKGTAPAFAPIISVQTNCCVSGLTFAPDGKTLASTSTGDQTVKLWEVGSHGAGPRGLLLHTLPGHADQSRCVAWSPDGRTLAYCSSDKAIWLWDVEENRCRTVLHGHTANVYGMAFTPEGTRLLSGSADGTLCVWDVESRQCVRVMQGYGVSLRDLAWSPNSTYLVSGDTDGLVTIWDMRDGMLPAILRGHSWIVSGVGWSPDGKYLSSCGLDGGLCLWDPISRTSIQRFEDPKVVLLSMAWSPDGSLLACGTYRRGIQVWDVTTRSLRFVGQTLPTAFHHVAWSPNGTQLVGGGDDGCVYLWENADRAGQARGVAPTKLLGHQGKIRSVGWSPDGRFVVSSGGSGECGELFVWDVKTGEQVQTFTGRFGIVYALAWCRSRIGARGQGQEMGASPIPTPPMSPYGPRGDLLVSGGNDGWIRWWDVQSGECVCMQESHQGTIRSLEVSPDGKYLASCGDDGAIRIWDLCSGGQAQEDRDWRDTDRGRRDSGLPLSESLRVPTAPPLLRMLRRDRPYERLNITGIRGLNEAQKASLQALGAIDETVSSL